MNTASPIECNRASFKKHALKTPADLTSLESVKEAFETFARQSLKLETAYRALEQDLAKSNRTLQERNLQLTAKMDEIQQVSSRLEGVIESLTDGLLVVGLNGGIERCNSAAASILERRRDQIEQQPFCALVTHEDAESLMMQILRGGEPILDCPWTLQDSQKSARYLLFSLAPVTTPDSSLIGIICHIRDITEIRRLEKKLNSHERLAALGEMAASVAHEIRNPLGTIEGFARLLRRDLAGMPSHLRLADKIVEGAQNLNYVITNLLTFVRPMQIQEEDVAVSDVLEAARDALEDRAAQTKVTLAFSLPERPVSFRGDRRQIMQALLNLGINAIEACPPQKGRVTIESKIFPQAVKLYIRDNGCGIAPENINKIFDPFFTAKEGGTGLGLSLSRKIIDAHGGDLSVSSTPGRETVFSIELPLKGVPR